jgi:mannan polymerase II complex MNN11 subunit
MALYPGSTYFFHLSPHAVIMEPSVSLTALVLDKKPLESLMLKNVPVVPPKSVIKTFRHVSASDVDLVLSQDAESLTPGSFILRRGDWAQYFLDAWFDPLYRSYNFAKAEIHALVSNSQSSALQSVVSLTNLSHFPQDHFVQWHPTILARLALVPQRIFNSYSPTSVNASADGKYKENDFLIRFYGCERDDKRDCEKEMEPYWRLWAKKTGNE